MLLQKSTPVDWTAFTRNDDDDCLFEPSTRLNDLRKGLGKKAVLGMKSECIRGASWLLLIMSVRFLHILDLDAPTRRLHILVSMQLDGNPLGFKYLAEFVT